MQHRLRTVNLILEKVKGLGGLHASGPVSLSLIREAILSLGLIARISTVPSKANGCGLKGAFIHTKFDNGTKDEARIYYDQDLPLFTYRYVIAKELSHVFDGKHERTETAQEIKDLAVFVASRTNASPMPANPANEAEEKAEHCAIELLFPFERRKVAIEEYGFSPSRIVIESLSFDLQMPSDAVQLSLTESYHSFIEEIRGVIGLLPLF